MKTNGTFLVALDGGGTHTRVRVATGRGSTVAEFQVRQTVKFFEVGFEESARRITLLIVRASKKANVPLSAISGVCIGLAGCGRDRDQRELRSRLKNNFRTLGIQPRKLLVESDALIAVEGLLGAGAGVVLICGTGAIVIGRTRSGDSVRVGGWGRIVGDEGSGYWIGAQALNAVGRDLDNRGPHTALTDRIFRAAAMSRSRDPRALRSAIASGAITVESVAAEVTACAAKRDSVANDILKRAAGELCGQLAAMHRAYFRRKKNVPLVFHGSVLERSPVGALLQRGLRRTLPGLYRVIHPNRSPLDGAIALLLTGSSQRRRI